MFIFTIFPVKKTKIIAEFDMCEETCLPITDLLEQKSQVSPFSSQDVGVQLGKLKIDGKEFAILWWKMMIFSSD